MLYFLQFLFLLLFPCQCEGSGKLALNNRPLLFGKYILSNNLHGPHHEAKASKKMSLFSFGLF